MSDFMAYDANRGEMIDLRECSDAELLRWLEASEKQGDKDLAIACRVLLDERDVPFLEQDGDYYP